MALEVRRAGVQTADDVDVGRAEPVVHPAPAVVVAQAGQQVHGSTEAAERDGDVGGAAAGVLLDGAVQAADHVDERLAHDEDGGGCGHRRAPSAIGTARPGRTGSRGMSVACTAW